MSRTLFSKITVFGMNNFNRKKDDAEDLNNFKVAMSEMSVTIQEAILSPESKEIAYVVAGICCKTISRKM